MRLAIASNGCVGKVAGAVAESVGPSEQRFHAARRARDSGDRSEADAGGVETIEHGVEPLEGVATGPGGEIGQCDARIGGECDVDEAVESAFCADVEFLRRGKEVAQGAALFVLGVAVEQRGGNAALA